MTKAKVAWISRDESPTDARKGKVSALHGYQEIKCHIVFDVKMARRGFVQMGMKPAHPPLQSIPALYREILCG